LFVAILLCNLLILSGASLIFILLPLTPPIVNDFRLFPKKMPSRTGQPAPASPSPVEAAVMDTSAAEGTRGRVEAVESPVASILPVTGFTDLRINRSDSDKNMFSAFSVIP
jgi:hypothetical protein